MSLYAKRLEAGTSVAIPAAQVVYLPDDIDRRNPRWTRKPEKVG